MADCPKCDGCGKVADTDDEEPWTAWLNLPLGSAAAVVLGIVRPKTCPACAGSGTSPAPVPGYRDAWSQPPSEAFRRTDREER